jgi:predicted dehydrogenase
MADTQVLRIAMNGITGRMGYRQHLLRSILPIRAQGGIVLGDGTRLTVEPVLVGRSAAKLEAIAREHGVEEWTTDLEGILEDPSIDIVFDASMTSLRAATLAKAMRAGKHVFTEKPTAETLAEALDLARIRQGAGVTAGVVHDKLYLPGLVKLRRLVDEGFFGRILSLRGEFGYWVFEGEHQSAQRPSWNYRAEDGGGMTTDMYCHWNYVLEGIVGPVRSVASRSVTHIPARWDEAGRRYDATADDAAYGIFELETPAGDPVIAQINSSWAVRVHRDELVEFQVDGTHGSAVAGLTRCVAQHRAHTPKPVWNPDLPVAESFRDQWSEVPANDEIDNGFKLQWEEFLRDVAAGRDHRFGLLSAARGVQLAELGLLSSAERRTVEVPALTVPDSASDAPVVTVVEDAAGSPAGLTADAVAGAAR